VELIPTLDQRGEISMAAPIFSRRFFTWILASLSLVAAPAWALPELHFILRPGPPAVQATPPLPSPAEFPVQLVLDDDTWEGLFGVGGNTAEEFLWFNRFASPGPFTLEEIWVLFPSAEANPGDPIQLVVYHDTDSDPSNGAELLATFGAPVLVADGDTFSVYDLSATPLEVPGGGEVWIGVINRWVIPGVTPLSAPATIDTDSDLGLSGFATWAGGAAPDPPLLAAATSIQNLSDTPGAGNFLIRAFGTAVPIVEVPVLDHTRLVLFAVLLTLAACVLFGLRRA
jgi:hypothetical protein